MRRMILLAGLALAVGVLLPGSARPAVGGSDLPLKGSFSGLSSYDIATAMGHFRDTGTITHFGLATLQVDAWLAV